MTSPDAAAAHGLAAALRRAGVGGVDTSSRRRAEYSSDASLYRVVPAVVAFPRSLEEVAAALAVTRDHGMPLTCRGGGTSIAGNAVGPGLVLDFSRHLAATPSVDADAATAVVMPGVVLDDLQRQAAPHGLRFGPDPSTHDRCTLAGMIGNNACGSRALAYGRTADNVVEMEVLTGSGELLRVAAGADPATSPTLQRLATLVASQHNDIRAESGRLHRQVSGYALEHLLPEHGFDVAKALVGSEGTCAIVLSATVRLVKRPAASLLVVLGYPDLASAADAVPALLPHGPTAMEGLDARIVEVVRARRGTASVPPLPRGEGWMFVELCGEDPAVLPAAADALVADAQALDATLVTDPGAAARLWRIREDGAGLTSRTVDGRAAHAGWEDAAVPPERLGSYLRDFEALLVEHDLMSMPYGHFGDGCLHVRIDFPLDRPAGAHVLRRFVVDAAHLVAHHGGSLSGEHGDGRARSELLPIMYSDPLMRAFAAFKGAFDPDDLLNPGVLVRPRPLDADLRSVTAGRPVHGSRPAFALADDGGDFGAAVHRCVGIGRCRADTTAVGGVMCPSYLATGDERESTRGRARVLQEMIDGRLVRDGWRSHEVHDALELCLACKGCRSDCPAEVDMATYKAEVLHQAYRRRLRPASHYAMGWLPLWARIATVAPGLVNRALSAPAVASAAKRVGGIDQGRRMPTFARRTFTDLFARARRDARPVPSVAGTGRAVEGSVLLWPDTFTNAFDPQVGVAAVKVLEDADMEVSVPPRPLCCGLTWISTGQLDVARRRLRRLVDALAPAVRAGMPVVGLEPSCLAVLRSDAVELLGPGDAAARDVAAGVRTLAEVLAARRPGWTPPRLDYVEVVAQPHCHQHAVMGWDADRVLLSAAGASVTALGGCCGLAGNFGFERGHLDISVAVAETALLPAVRSAAADVEILADGFSCRTQVDQLTGRRARHLAELLADHL